VLWRVLHFLIELEDTATLNEMFDVSWGKCVHTITMSKRAVKRQIPATTRTPFPRSFSGTSSFLLFDNMPSKPDERLPTTKADDTLDRNDAIDV